jgi:hypothetical protein
LKKPPIHETEGLESTHMTPKDKPSKGRAKLAFLNLENIELEIIQPIDGPSTWQAFLDKNGEEIHHIAFHVENWRKHWRGSGNWVSRWSRKETLKEVATFTLIPKAISEQ